MFLKSLELYGFKSFADKTKLDFSDGITSLLGPNGCGKSNIVDAIKWVLGEQSTKTLRAGKMEDVIFNGTDKRNQLQMAEVILIINNEGRHLNLDVNEIEIKRRVFRSGESEYYLNKNRVLLKNIKELFFDTGVGKSAYSILEQGKIDQILSTRPEDRRYIFEEAAGISRFKQQSKEAQRKIERTDENIAQVDTILREVKRTYDSKKTQAAKCFKYNELNKEKFNLEVEVQLSTVKSYLLLKEDKQKRLLTIDQEIQNKSVALNGLDAVISEMQEELRSKTAKRVEIQTELKRLEEEHKGKTEFIELLNKYYKEALINKQTSHEKAKALEEKLLVNEELIKDKYSRIERLKNEALEIESDINKLEKSLESAKSLIIKQNDEINELEKKIQENEETYDFLAIELNKITDTIVVQLDEKLKSSGYSYENRKSLRDKIEDKLNYIISSLENQSQFLEQLNTLDSSQLAKKIAQDKKTNIDNMVSLKSLIEEYDLVIPSFIDDFISEDGVVSKKHQLDKQILSNRENVNIYRNQIAYLRNDNEKLNTQCSDYKDSISELKIMLEQINGSIGEHKVAIDTIRRSNDELKLEYNDRVIEAKSASQKAESHQENIRVTEEEMDNIAQRGISLSQKLEELIEQIEISSNEINMKQNQKNVSFDTVNKLRREKDQSELQIQSIGEMVEQIYNNFFETYSKNLAEYEDKLNQELEDPKILRNKLEDVKKEISRLGYINQMAADEFEEAKQQYDFLSSQIDDLMKAKADLENVVLRITNESEERFLTTYKQISENFQSMFRRLFGGGRAELKLSDPDNILESGINILAQPPGKKLTNLSLLSGGERSMTAVGLLFATYQVKPSPFCILDEIDAALDDRNIGFFLSVLEEFSRDSQFIIITHNKHTVTGSRTLLGVTQIEAGVSTTVSYKIGVEKGAPVILSLDDKEVDV
ncbi:MAG: AAA family ATPase [Sphaerochaetaceae bacterium]|nr:AAA family ATPase [Sphaerochaetaceae bacterium]MDC7249988.1 AAA family ATPase [Sphaerochaetaceae bacterium]